MGQMLEAFPYMVTPAVVVTFLYPVTVVVNFFFLFLKLVNGLLAGNGNKSNTSKQ